MELLTDLNRTSGITVLMVTHEADMAAFARTIVHFKDGLVERIDTAAPIGGAGGLMFGTTFLLAIRSIRRHMLRSFLTTSASSSASARWSRW